MKSGERADKLKIRLEGPMIEPTNESRQTWLPEELKAGSTLIKCLKKLSQGVRLTSNTLMQIIKAKLRAKEIGKK